MLLVSDLAARMLSFLLLVLPEWVRSFVFKGPDAAFPQTTE